MANSKPVNRDVTYNKTAALRQAATNKKTDANSNKRTHNPPPTRDTGAKSKPKSGTITISEKELNAIIETIGKLTKENAELTANLGKYFNVFIIR